MSRRKSSNAFSQQWAKNSLAIALVIVLLAVAVLIFSKTPIMSGVTSTLPSFSSSDKEEQQEVMPPENVSTDMLAKLSEGTALIFGAKPDPGKPVVSIIGDPAELSRASYIVNGKPSGFLNAINENKATLYYYPVGTEDKKVSTDSITRASVCRIGAEKTPTGIFTLTGIVNTGDKVTGSETVEKVSEMMGMSKDVQCPVSTNEASTQTTTNGEFFAEHFGLGRDGNGSTAIVVGDEVITHPENLPANWSQLMLAGKPLREIIQPARDIEVETSTQTNDSPSRTTTSQQPESK